ncbi:PAS domain S-box-containing protein [Streptomyces sp. V4I23]|uniref:SpoIIE family protein phosphatase n=1 Tax=Streptomyces sp. V4I23 TaxID=3042282 RepID=UPI00277F6B62|nr:SpoIIE family protein phosphatase [Streptomyces sp. V4I23]MDQ1012128.1 PAS domain S-box-containing protein [Streptomyces sp. V4I23]
MPRDPRDRPAGPAEAAGSRTLLPRRAVAVVDTDGVLTAWAPGAERLLGYRSAEAIGHTVSLLFAAELPISFRRSLADGGEWSGLVELRHRDGRRVVVDLQVSPLYGAVGSTVWVMGATEPDDSMGSDTAGALTGWALEQLPISLGVFDQENRLVDANAEAYRTLGVRKDEAIGRRLGEIRPGPPYNRLEQLAAQALRTGESVTARTLDRTPGAHDARAWSEVVYPLRDGDGRVRGVSIAAVDVTEQDRARRRLSLVNAVGLRVGTTLEVTRTAQELADVATERFADFVGVDLLDSVFRGRASEPGPHGLVYFRAAQQSILEGCPESAIPPGEADIIAEDSPMARALATGRALRHRISEPGIQRWLANEPARARRAREFGIHSYLAAPLLARGTTLGLVIFLRHRTPEPFDVDDLLLASELAARAALSIDNARRYTQERNTALALQRSMLPQHAPRQSAVDVAFRYLPADAVEGVGGDWFDVIPLSGARVALVVGDVVGRGIQASATMGRLRTAVRTLADIDMPPDELLTHLDDLVLRLDREEGPLGEEFADRADGDIGATCLYAVYDPVSRRCTLARAGHPGPAVVAPDGSVDFPELPSGPPLGLGGLPFESAEMELPEGSLIALYTDGLIASADSDIDVGLAALRGALADPAPSLRQLCDHVLEASPTDRPADDVALLLARTRALDASQVAGWDLPSDPAEVARARKLTTDQLAAWGLEDASFVTELVVSELVTNAIRYGRPPVRLRLIHDAGLICEVSDGSSTAPHMRRARTFDEGGRGLLIVAQLTQRWGTRHSSLGKTIWAEQDLQSAG